MPLHDLRGERKAKTGAAFSPWADFVCTPEAVEDVIECGGLDADSRIRNRNGHVGSRSSQHELNGTSLGVFDGVIQQDKKEAAQLRAIARDWISLPGRAAARVSPLAAAVGVNSVQRSEAPLSYQPARLNFVRRASPRARSRIDYGATGSMR